MNFKYILDEAINRGEKIKQEVIAEILKSKTIQEIVMNKNFVKAVTRLIETKEEVKKVINKQVKTIFDMMDVPTQRDLLKIGKKLTKLESILNRVGRKTIPVKSLKKTKSSTKRKKTIKKTKKLTSKSKKRPVKKKTAPRKKTKKIVRKTAKKRKK